MPLLPRRSLACFALGALAAALWIGPGQAQPAGPGADKLWTQTKARLGPLSRAYASGQRDNFRRRAASSSGNDLTRALRSGDAHWVRIAARAAPLCVDAPELLLPLAELAGSPDRVLAVAAITAAMNIANRSEARLLVWNEVPLEVMGARIKAFRAVGEDPGRWTDIRVLALETAVHLHKQLGTRASPADAPFSVEKTIVDIDPEIRRAALELIAPERSRNHRQEIAEVVRTDDVDLVAAVAAQVLCEDLAFAGPPSAILDALQPQGLARLRTLVADASIPRSIRRQAARCLVADGSRESKSALSKLPGGAAK